MVDELEEGRLCPVDVFEREHERPAGGDRLDQLAGAPEDLVDGELGAGEPDRRGHALDGARVPSLGTDELPELLQSGVGRIVVGDGSRLPHGLAKGPERDTAPVREAAAAQQQAPGERIVERGEQARLPHARITEDRRQPAVPSAAASMCSRRRRRSSRSLPTSGAALR